jgi:hypothetical protein
MMNRKLSLLGALFIYSSVAARAQDRFEGIVKFKTDISVTHSAPKNFLKQLEEKYGDSLNIYYSSRGDIVRQYLNTGKFGNNYQLYHKGSKSLVINDKGATQDDTLDVSKNTLKLIKMTKSKKDTVMGLPCRCYAFKAFDDHDQRTVTFCYSKKTPKIKPRDYKWYKDYFVSRFYKLSRRPYLKFSINARDFNLTFTAVEIFETEVDSEIFNK